MIREEIIQEIEEIKKQNRKNKRALCALALAVPLLVCLAAVPKELVTKTLKVQSLQIVDGKGKTRAEFGSDTDGSVALTMTPTEDGKGSVFMNATPKGTGSFAIYKALSSAKSGDRSCILLTNDQELGCGLFIIGKDGNAGLECNSSEKSNPQVMMTDSKGDTRLAALVDDKLGTLFALTGGKENSGSAHIGVDPDGISAFSLRKSISGKEKGGFSMIELYANDPQDGNVLHITDEGGTSRAAFFCNPDDSTELRFNDILGRTRLGIGYADDTSSILFRGTDGKARMAVTDTTGKGSNITWYSAQDEITKTVTNDTTEDAK